MTTPIFRYPLDPTGTNPDNLVVREPHTLNPKSNPQDVRVFSPLYGPFYAPSVVILDAVTTLPLTRDIDYKITDLLQDPTLEFGQEIGQFIVITNGSVSSDIEVSYQVLGGNYQNDTTAVQHVYETFLNDTRPVDWSNISGKPSTFPPSLHIHLLQDIVNFGPLVVAIDSLRDAKLLNNTPQFEALIDWIKNRVINWNEIANKPTTVDGFGITDAVTLFTPQTIPAKKIFEIVDLGRGSTAISVDDGQKSAIATVGHLARSVEPLALKETKITAGPGLKGGGTLGNETVLSLALPKTLSTTTTNAVMVDGHTHQLDLSALIAAITPKYKWYRRYDRVNGGAYVNTFPYVIYVAVSTVNTGYWHGVTVYCDGVQISSMYVNPDGKAHVSTCFPVPPGASYSVHASAGISIWAEMY